MGCEVAMIPLRTPLWVEDTIIMIILSSFLLGGNRSKLPFHLAAPNLTGQHANKQLDHAPYRQISLDWFLLWVLSACMIILRVFLHGYIT